MTQLLLTLRFYATGTMSAIVKRVFSAIASLRQQFICTYYNHNEMQELPKSFITLRVFQ
jgi:hypothetical protein